LSAEPSVGVAIPVRNGARFLAETLHSALAQTFPPCDVVVVDDGSKDRSEEVARAFGPPVRVVRQQRAGAGAARSLAISLVRGEFVVPLDADDLLTATSVEARLGLLAAGPALDIVYGQVRSFSACRAGQPVALDDPRPAHVPDGMLIRRSSYERVGPFAAGLQVAECLDWLLRARELGLREETVSHHVLWRRVHGENNSITARGSIGEFPRALKASLDRRRASQHPLP
jgi:glycosyltransferase involved in cell wall biosynthesis